MSTKTLAASLDNDLAEWGEGRINDLFDHFLPLLEKYLPLEPTATYLIQSKLLTRKEYFHLKDDEGKRAQIYNDGSFVKRLVDIVANKGPKAFVLFFNALEFCRDDSNDCHLGLEHVIKEIRQFLEENGLIAQVNADRELDADERDAHEWRMTRPYRSKFRVRSTDSLLVSPGCMRGVGQHVQELHTRKHFMMHALNTNNVITYFIETTVVQRSCMHAPHDPVLYWSPIELISSSLSETTTFKRPPCWPVSEGGLSKGVLYMCTYMHVIDIVYVACMCTCTVLKFKVRARDCINMMNQMSLL